MTDSDELAEQAARAAIDRLGSSVTDAWPPIPLEPGPERMAALEQNLAQMAHSNLRLKAENYRLIGLLGEAVKDVCWRAVQWGSTEDGDTFAYLVTKGAMHRLIGAAQSCGISASFRASAEHLPDSRDRGGPMTAGTDYAKRRWLP